MEKGSGTPPSLGFFRTAIRWWFALTGRKIRLLQAHAMDMVGEGPTLFVVSHPAGFLPALTLATAIGLPVRCLLPESVVRSPFARFLARRLGIILHEGERPTSEAVLREALDVLARGEGLVVFADPNAPCPGATQALASIAASLVLRAETQHVGRSVRVYPVHLFLPESWAPLHEILIYVDSPMTRPAGQPAAPSPNAETPALATALEARLRENAFQLRPADLDYFLGDIEEVLRTDLQEDWASRPDWEQDAEGFGLSRWVREWVKGTNYLHPGRLVTLRQSLEDYRRLQRQCALRQLEVEGVDSLRSSGWRQILFWFEALLGLPIALYGLLNHLGIGLVLFLAGSFKRDNPRARTTEWTIRGVVTLAFYVFQVLLVSRWLGRAAAGYYLPTLPVTGAYLWRYMGLVRSQARLLFISMTIPGITKKTIRMRQALLEELDQMLAPYEENAGAATLPPPALK